MTLKDMGYGNDTRNSENSSKNSTVAIASYSLLLIRFIYFMFMNTEMELHTRLSVYEFIITPKGANGWRCKTT
jgi:hypothetical protein